MPLRRYQIRNEYGWADPELYRAAAKDDPEALLEGVSMAGLVGVLRQLGDLAEFAADIFHDLHEEVMTTAARGHGLMARVQQLEAEFPTLEKALLSKINHSLFFSNADVVDWHPDLQSQQNLITSGDLPRFVMDSYEECRGPPRLFLLDKFDVAGAGACLKRYTDPSIFKTESLSSEKAMSKIHREKRTRKTKKKGMRRNGESPEVAPTHAKLHQLFLEERFENNYNDTARLVKLKRRQLNGSGVDWKSDRSYMEKFLDNPSPDNKIICVTPTSPMPLNMLDSMHEDAIKTLEIGTTGPVKHSMENCTCSSPNEREAMRKLSMNLNGMVLGVLNALESTPDDKPGQIYSSLDDVVVEKKMTVDRLNKQGDSPSGHHSDDVASEIDNYMDALTTMESEMETDNEHRPRNSYLSIGKQGTDSEGNDGSQAQFYDSQSSGNSSVSDENGLFKKNISTFSYSDTLSSVVDNAPSDGDVAAKLLSSDWSCEGEVMDKHSNQLHMSVQLQKPECNNSVVPSYAPSKRENFPDLGEASTDTCLTSSIFELLQSDAGANTASAQYLGPQTENMLSESVKSHPGLSENEEDCNRNTTTLVSDDISLMKNDLSMDSSGTLPVDKFHLGCHHQDVNSDSVFKCCNVSVSIPDDEHNDSSLNEEPQTAAMNKSSETLDDGKIASPERHLNIASIAPVETYPGVLPEELGSVSYVADPNGEDSKSEGGFVATKFTLEESSLTVDMWQASNLVSPFFLDAPFTGKIEAKQQSALTCTNLQVGPGSKGIEVLCDNEKSYGEGYHRLVNGEVRGTSICGVDSVVDDRAFEYQPHPSDHPETDQEIWQSLTDELSEAVDGDNVVSGVPAGDCTKNYANEVIGSVSDVILSPSQNLADMQESHAKVEYFFLKLLHSNEASSTEICKEWETQKQMRQPEPSSEILCPTINRNTNSHESGPENGVPCNGVELKKPVPIEFERERDMNNQESYSHVSSSAVGDFADSKESTSFTVPQGRENLGYSTEILSEVEAHEETHELQVVTPDLESMRDGQKTSRDSYSDTYNTLHGSVAELIYRSSGVYDSTTQTDNSNLERKDSETIPISQSHVPQDEEAAKASLEHPEPGTFVGQSLESNGELHTTEFMKKIEKEIFRTERMHSSNTPYLKEYSTAASLFSPEIVRESPVLKSFSYPAEVFDQPKQFLCPVEPISPSLVPLPTQINNDDVPPMPPLPPMQWLGKGQPSSLGSRRQLDGGSHVTFKPLLTSRNDERAQLGLHISHQGILLPENLSFSAMDVKGGIPQHASEFITSDLRQPVQIVPLTSTSSKCTGHFSYFPMDGSQAQNQYQTSCSRFTEGNSPTYPSAGEEIFQHMNSSSQAVPTKNVGNVLDSVSLQEAAVPPSSPPMAETSPEVHQSSPHNLVGMTMHLGIISSSPPFAETVQLQSNELPSDIDVLDPSLPISLSEDGKINGQGSTKLPRPRNPLIDAVVAHDKSKLRKVAERVQPQLAPNLDERDSLLEQIRTKSFNLKPAITARPSIQGPRTNLKVAAILEKANAIRQAFAGSDEDDDADSWSDS